jgi:hypothetical protein
VTVDENQWLADRFEEHRAHLRAVAYRMLAFLEARFPPDRVEGTLGSNPSMSGRAAIVRPAASSRAGSDTSA